jgi:hypothetical protein
VGVVDVQAEEGVLVVEGFHFEIVEGGKLDGDESVFGQDEVALGVQVAGHQPQVNFGGEDWEVVDVCVGVDVAAPEMKIEDFGVVEGGPAAEDGGEFLCAEDLGGGVGHFVPFTGKP